MEVKINNNTLKFSENKITSILNFDILNCFVSDRKKSKSKNTIFKKIYYCSDDLDQFINYSIYEDIKDKVNSINTTRLKELIKMFMLNEDILKKMYTELSTSELKKILLICALLSEKKTLIFKNPTNYLDDKSKDLLIKELKRLKKTKTIIIESCDTDSVLKMSDYVAFLDKNNNVLYGSKYEIFKNIELFNSSGLKIPDIIMFIDMVIELKGIKLGYRDDINDTVKDIYRNV